MSDSDRVSRKVCCGNCGDEYHHMDSFVATGFDMERVCMGCVGSFLQDGEWP